MKVDKEVEERPIFQGKLPSYLHAPALRQTLLRIQIIIAKKFVYSHKRDELIETQEMKRTRLDDQLAKTGT